MHLLADATLPELDLAFPPPFQLTRYHTVAELQDALPDHTILLCRSTLKVNQALLNTHHLEYVLTASSGRDHIDETYLATQRTVVLDAKGSNASAVVDYVCSTLRSLQHHEQVTPKTIGIIGMGEVGSRLAARLSTQPYLIVCYDPFLAYPATLTDIVQCDVVCVHAHLHRDQPFPSYHLIDNAFLSLRPAQSVIINAARGEVVDEAALLAVHQGMYCTDVYANEPAISPAIIQCATRCTPHIAGHTVEAKVEAVRQLSRQLHACYHLPSPLFPPHAWIAQAGGYDPIHETQALKQAHPLPLTFLSLRAAHVRHGQP